MQRYDFVKRSTFNRKLRKKSTAIGGRKKKEEIPGADGAADTDGKRSFIEIAIEERRRSSGEVAGEFNWLVRVRRQPIVAMVHLPVLTNPRLPVPFAAD